MVLGEPVCGTELEILATRHVLASPTALQKPDFLELLLGSSVTQPLPGIRWLVYSAEIRLALLKISLWPCLCIRPSLSNTTLAVTELLFHESSENTDSSKRRTGALD